METRAATRPKTGARERKTAGRAVEPAANGNGFAAAKITFWAERD